MALTQAYVNEVLNTLASTVVVDEQTWPELIRLLKFEGRDLTTLVIGRMRLRQAVGGYDGLTTSLAELLKENEALRAQVTALSNQPNPLYGSSAKACCADDVSEPALAPVHG